jgi:hypothetical protein
MTSLIHLQSLAGTPLEQIKDLLNLDVTRDNAKVGGNLRAKMTVQWDPKTKKVPIKNVFNQGSKDVTVELPQS